MRLRTADELVAELLSGFSPDERAAWDAETDAMIATARARLARREGASARGQRELEREGVGKPIHMDDAPLPDHSLENLDAVKTFLGDGPLAPPDPWPEFARWNPLEDA